MFCSKCGRPLQGNERFCGACGAPVAAAGTPDPAMRYILPVDRSGWAIAAGYLGLFSVLLLPAPFALACGVRALVVLKRRPALLGRGRAWLGVVAGALGSLALAALLIGAATGK